MNVTAYRNMNYIANTMYGQLNFQLPQNPNTGDYIQISGDEKYGVWVG
jgi:hypothetical protein